MDLHLLASQPRLIKTTRSRCPVCLAAAEAAVVEVGGRILLRRRCPDHGEFLAVLAKDPRFWHLSKGSATCCEGTGCCGSAPADRLPSADPFDRLSTCVALIEIVRSCNLTCPTCYAASPFGVGEHVDAVPFEEITARIRAVLDRKGSIDIVQLSGGEPTIHPEFLAVLEWCLEHPRIGYVLVNTNAVRIARDAAFRAELGQLRRARGKFELYVQFDGPQEAGQRSLRGADLRAVREEAIDGAGALGVPSTLAMTVSESTLPFVADTLRFGLGRPHVRGVTFQPIFTSGRIPAIESSLPVARPVAEPISVGDVIHALVDGAAGLLRLEDFTPLPCGDPNCHTIGYLLRTPQGPVGLSRLIDLSAMQGFLKERVDYRLDDLIRCGCETEPLGAVLKGIELSPDAPFRIFLKPFMDAWTYDEDRIDRCCTHVIREDGSLDSFCRHYLAGGRGEA